MAPRHTKDGQVPKIERIAELIDENEREKAGKLIQRTLERSPGNVRLQLLKARLEVAQADRAAECGRLLSEHRHLRDSDPYYRALLTAATEVVDSILTQDVMRTQRLGEIEQLLNHAGNLAQHDGQLTLSIAIAVHKLGVAFREKLDRDAAKLPPEWLPLVKPSLNPGADILLPASPDQPDYFLWRDEIPEPFAKWTDGYLQKAIERAGDQPAVCRQATNLAFQLMVTEKELTKAAALLCEQPALAEDAPMTARVLTIRLLEDAERQIALLMRQQEWQLAGEALGQMEQLALALPQTALLRAELALQTGDHASVERRLVEATQIPALPAWDSGQFAALAQWHGDLLETCNGRHTPFEALTLTIDRPEWNELTHLTQAHWWLAEVLAEQGKTEAAIAELQQAAGQVPKDHPAQIALENLRLQFDQAVREANRIQAVLSLLGEAEWGAAQLRAVRAEFERPSLPWPEIPLAERVDYVERALAAGFIFEGQRLMRCAFDDARETEAVQTLQKTVDSALAAEAVVRAERSRQARSQRRYDEALKEARTACQLDPGSLLALEARAQALQSSGNAARAIEDFRELQRRVGQDHGAAFQLEIARILADNHQIPEAIEALDGIDTPAAATLRERFDRTWLGRPAIALHHRRDGVLYDTLERDDNLDQVHATFAIALRASSRPWDSSEASWTQTILGSQLRLVQMLGGLTMAEGDPVFGLRLIGHPVPSAPERGKVTMALLARVSAANDESCLALANQLFDVLQTALPGQENHAYWFAAVSDETELAELLVPFAATSYSEIVRREEDSHDQAIPTIYPFLPATLDLHALCWALLRQPGPAMVSIHLQPTVLYPWEGDHLGRGTAAPDIHESILRVADNDETGWQALQRKNGTQVNLTHLSQLRTRAYLLQVNAVGSELVSRLFADSVAAALFGPTQQAGSTLHGGWEICSAQTASEMEAATRNCERIDLERWVYTAASSKLTRLRSLVSESEAMLTFRMPVPLMRGLPGIELLAAKPILPPLNMPTKGTVYGESVARVGGRPISIIQGYDDRRRHAFLLGQTGSGKSTLLSQMVLQDIAQGKGLCVIDPHGELIHDILARIPESRAGDVILFDAADVDRPIGLNLLEYTSEYQKQRIVTEFIGMLMRMYDPKQIGIVGPRFQHNVRMAMLTAMSVPGNTLIEVVRVLSSREYARSLLKYVTDPLVLLYWKEQISNTNDFHKSEILDYLVSKFNRFVGDVLVRNIIGQRKTALNFREIMDSERILLVNLSKGLIGPENSHFLGLLLVQQLLITALGRADVAADSRPDFVLYVDEFQNFATELFSTVLSEGRKYGLVAVVANQYLTQLDHEIREAIFGNVGTLMSFRVGVNDAKLLAAEMYPSLGMDDLINLPKYTMAAKLLVDGDVDQPFTMRTLPLLDTARPEVAASIRATSRERYGADAETVSQEILTRLHNIMQ